MKVPLEVQPGVVHRAGKAEIENLVNYRCAVLFVDSTPLYLQVRCCPSVLTCKSWSFKSYHVLSAKDPATSCVCV